MTSDPQDFHAKSDFLRELIARGHVHQATDLEALDRAAQKGVTAYIGYDLSTDSGHRTTPSVDYEGEYTSRG